MYKVIWSEIRSQEVLINNFTLLVLMRWSFLEGGKVKFHFFSGWNFIFALVVSNQLFTVEQVYPYSSNSLTGHLHTWPNDHPNAFAPLLASSMDTAN